MTMRTSGTAVATWARASGCCEKGGGGQVDHKHRHPRLDCGITSFRKLKAKPASSACRIPGGLPRREQEEMERQIVPTGENDQVE